MKSSRSKPMRIFELIANLQENEIRELSGSRSFERGQRYFDQDRLLSFSWEKENLKAVVVGSRPYEIRIVLKRTQNLSSSCTCPTWSLAYQCKHVVCAFLTIRHILLSIPHTRSGHYNVLERQLLNALNLSQSDSDGASKRVAAANSKKIQIHLMRADEGEMELKFRLGNNVLSNFSSKIPKTFRKWMRRYLNYSHDALEEESAETTLRRFLDAPDCEFELWVHTKKGPVQARWQSERRVVPKLKLDFCGGVIKVQRLATVESGDAPTHFARIGQGLLLDISSAFLFPFEDPRSWVFADFLEKKNGLESEANNTLFYEGSWDQAQVGGEFNLDSNPLEVTVSDFNQTHFVLVPKDASALLADILCFVEGDEVSARETSSRFRVSLFKSEDPSRMRMDLEGLLEASSFSFQNHPLLCGFRLRWETDFERSYFLKQRDKDLIRQAMAHLVLSEAGNTKKTEKIIRETQKLFRDNYRVRSFVGRHLKELVQLLKQSHEAVQFVAFSGQWFLGKTSIGKVLEIFSLAYLFFGKEVYSLCEKGAPALVSKRRIFENLVFFKKELESRTGAELYFDKKAVHISSLDFSIDATRKAEEDWFEIHPEIKLNQELLSREDRDSLLREGFFIKEDVVEVVDSNSREILGKLERFLDRRESFSKTRSRDYLRVPPLEIFDWMTLKKLGIEVKLNPADEERVSRLLRFLKIPAVRLPRKFQGALREYQREGYHWLAFLYENRFGACLADDMGLGKTVQALAFLAGLKEGKIKQEAQERSRPHLIVMPSSLVFNWESEIKRFYPDFKVVLYIGQERACHFEGADIVLTTYDLLRRDIEKIKNEEFHVILFDEAQMIKNLFSARTSAVRSLKGRFTMAMTGTPFENHLGEYYSVMDLCLPGLFGEYEHFRAQTKDDDLGFLTYRARPFVLRRTKDKILKELPSKIESDIYLSLTDRQKLFYQKTVEEVKGNIEKAYREKTEAQARIMALTGMLRLRQICVSPALVYPEIKESSPKIEHLTAKLQELSDEGHAALVFSQFTSFLDLLEKDLTKEKIHFCRLDGQTPLQKRRERVEAFQKKDGPLVFLISLKAGGFGLNLTRANYVFHLDPWWNPAVDRQASDRAHRIGQDKTVFVQRILMRHTIEEKVMALRNTKWELFQTVMDDDSANPKRASLSRTDFDFLLS